MNDLNKKGKVKGIDVVKDLGLSIAIILRRLGKAEARLEALESMDIKPITITLPPMDEGFEFNILRPRRKG